jgi:Ca-activated chloride channel family protein
MWLGICAGALFGRPVSAQQAEVSPKTEPAEVTNTSPTGPRSPFTIVREAQQALDTEQFAHAEALLSEAMEALPAEASLPYNLGVARFRQGDFQGAAEAFTRASELAADPNLAARAAFNQGTSTYADALRRMNDEAGLADVGQSIEQSKQLVGDSLDQLKHAIESNPQDHDARANAELAHRLLKKLEELQQQMQQQQQQQNQNQDQQDQDQQDSDQQQDQQQQQQGGEQENQDQQQSQDAENQNQNQNESQNQEQEQEQQQSQGETEQEENQEQQSAEAESRQDERPSGEQREGQPREGSMTREQAERLLQMVRDKQRERRAALAAQRGGNQKPAAKDW